MIEEAMARNSQLLRFMTTTDGTHNNNDLRNLIESTSLLNSPLYSRWPRLHIGDSLCQLLSPFLSHSDYQNLISTAPRHSSSRSSCESVSTRPSTPSHSSYGLVVEGKNLLWRQRSVARNSSPPPESSTRNDSEPPLRIPPRCLLKLAQRCLPSFISAPDSGNTSLDPSRRVSLADQCEERAHSIKSEALQSPNNLFFSPSSRPPSRSPSSSSSRVPEWRRGEQPEGQDRGAISREEAVARHVQTQIDSLLQAVGAD